MTYKLINRISLQYHTLFYFCILMQLGILIEMSLFLRNVRKFAQFW